MVWALADHPEWRPLDNKAHRDQRLHLFDFDLECVVSVTFGACMVIPNKRRITKACEGTGIQFLQAMIIRGEDDTCSVKCISEEHFPSLLEMADTGLIAEQKMQRREIGSRLSLHRWMNYRTISAMRNGSISTLRTEEPDWARRYLLCM